MLGISPLDAPSESGVSPRSSVSGRRTEFRGSVGAFEASPTEGQEPPVLDAPPEEGHPPLVVGEGLADDDGHPSGEPPDCPGPGNDESGQDMTDPSQHLEACRTTACPDSYQCFATMGM